MKIVCSDNRDRETTNDILIAENVNKYYGETIVALLNKDSQEWEECYYKLVENDYKLYKFES